MSYFKIFSFWRRFKSICDFYFSFVRLFCNWIEFFSSSLYTLLYLWMFHSYNVHLYSVQRTIWGNGERKRKRVRNRGWKLSKNYNWIVYDGGELVASSKFLIFFIFNRFLLSSILSSFFFSILSFIRCRYYYFHNHPYHDNKNNNNNNHNH